MSTTVFQKYKSVAIQNGWQSQDQRATNLRSRYAKSTLKRISVNEREALFQNLKKGQNKEGGTYGKESQDVTMGRTSSTFWNQGATLKAASQSKVIEGRESWGTQVQDPVASSQKYQFDQKCPIIVRGKSNIDPNHLAIRNVNGNIHNGVSI